MIPKEIIAAQLYFYGDRGHYDVADKIVSELHRCGFVIVKSEQLDRIATELDFRGDVDAADKIFCELHRYGEAQIHRHP